MKDYDENKDSSYLKYWEVDNFYQWTKVAGRRFLMCWKYISIKKSFKENNKGDSDKGHFLEVHKLKCINNLPFSPEKMKFEKVEKLFINLYDKKRLLISIKEIRIKSQISIEKRA